jgi:hypothetical protein
MRISKVSAREVTDTMRLLYWQASKKGKAAQAKVLDHLVAATGYHRKYAIRLLNHPPQPKPKKHRQRQRIYTVNLIQPLTFIWQVCGHICSKRLQPFLPEMAVILERLNYLHLCAQERQLLATISHSTIDRLLAPARHRLGGRGRSTTKPGTLLRKAIPIRTFADWNDDRPGFLEMDLVAHCGETTSGDYLCTLDTVDIATCWSECIVPANRGQHAVCAALEELRQRLPFPLLGIDSDNDASFINDHLLRYCQREKLTFTRSRPYKKNDQAHIEQKNWSIVRQLVGYDRYEKEAAGPLNALYLVLHLYTNFFQPVLKLKEKIRVDGKVKKVYDEAQTPYQRTLASPRVSQENKDRLTQLYSTLDPVALREDLDRRLRDLWEHYRVRSLHEATIPPK